MLLPEIKEREYRFRLALRMGLPIFALILAFISSTFISTYESLQPAFYFSSILLLVFSIYFIFFLIYRGFDERITETVTKTFTREYLYKFLNTKLQKEYTLILLSVDNIHDINTRYGIKNGDKVLYNVVHYIEKYLDEKSIKNFPMGHIKGGDFIIGLRGKKENYTTILDLLCLKSSEFKVDGIEVEISGAITDTNFSNNLEYMIEKLFDLQEENKNKKIIKSDDINPNDLELYVIDAIKNHHIKIATQDVFEEGVCIMQEYFIKLLDPNGKILHPKSYSKVLSKLGLTAEYDFIILKKSIQNFIDTDNSMFCVAIHPTSLRDSSFLDKVKSILDDYSDVKGKIVFLISESQYYSHIQRYNFTLQTLRKQGVKIAIDKLGSLHTSFLYLRELDIDIVRFDSLYTKESNEYESIINGFNIMAQAKGVKTWLRMIQTQEVKLFADKIGINYTQGNLLSKVK